LLVLKYINDLYSSTSVTFFFFIYTLLPTNLFSSRIVIFNYYSPNFNYHYLPLQLISLNQYHIFKMLDDEEKAYSACLSILITGILVMLVILAVTGLKAFFYGGVDIDPNSAINVMIENRDNLREMLALMKELVNATKA